MYKKYRAPLNKEMIQVWRKLIVVFSNNNNLHNLTCDLHAFRKQCKAADVPQSILYCLYLKRRQ